MSDLKLHLYSETVPKIRNYRYDRLAFRYVSYVAIPALLIYTGYSLVYESHKGWYSFVITTLTSFVYMFGFVRFCEGYHEAHGLMHLSQAQLIPQLIINYKLKVCLYLFSIWNLCTDECDRVWRTCL